MNRFYVVCLSTTGRPAMHGCVMKKEEIPQIPKLFRMSHKKYTTIIVSDFDEQGVSIELLILERS